MAKPPPFDDVPKCRLFVIMASNAPVAVVLRRGPSKWYQIIAWNTRHDTFVDGAWFKGRIYEDKCDVSPDGRLFAYFCHQGSRLSTDYSDAWTAVSRLPWLSALGLWPSGTTYGGGGRFLSNDKLMLRTQMDPKAHSDHPARGLEVVTGSPDLHRSTNEIEGADWCGRDQLGRLVFAREGRLFYQTGEGSKELADFNDRKPNPVPAPASATVPLSG